MAQSFYQSLQSLPATALTTPASLKRAYADAKQAYAAFVPLVEQAQAQAQTAGQTANAARFRNLVELYNEQYQKLAAAGKKQAAAALARADAGYGNSYAGAVSEQAFNRHMAEQGAQMPALLAAAAAAEARDKAAQVSAAERVIAAQKQQQGAAQALVKVKCNSFPRKMPPASRRLKPCTRSCKRRITPKKRRQKPLPAVPASVPVPEQKAQKEVPAAAQKAQPQAQKAKSGNTTAT